MPKTINLLYLLCSTLLLFGCQSSDSEIFSTFSIKTSASPNQTNIIEIQEMSKEDNVGLHASGRAMFYSLRIYYGEYASLLEDFVVIEDVRMYSIDTFEVVWTDDEHVTINLMPSDNVVVDDEVRNFEVETYEFDFGTETLSK